VFKNPIKHVLLEFLNSFQNIHSNMCPMGITTTVSLRKEEIGIKKIDHVSSIVILKACFFSFSPCVFFYDGRRRLVKI